MEIYLFCKTCKKKVKEKDTKKTKETKNGSTLICNKCKTQNTFITGSF